MSDDPACSEAQEIADLLVRVYEIHEILIAETGGLPGLRDAGLLHAAVARPFATFDGRPLYATDLERAAALFQSLLTNHPFIDGGKRTALAATLYFLERCGVTIPDRLPQQETVAFCLSVAGEGAGGRAWTVAEIAEWFRQLLEL